MDDLTLKKTYPSPNIAHSANSQNLLPIISEVVGWRGGGTGRGVAAAGIDIMIPSPFDVSSYGKTPTA